TPVRRGDDAFGVSSGIVHSEAGRGSPTASRAGVDVALFGSPNFSRLCAGLPVTAANRACDLRVASNSLNFGFKRLGSGAVWLPGTSRELIRVPASNATAGAEATPLASNGALIRRMLALSWRYRWGCLRLLVLQGLLLWTALAALDLSGVGIDVVLYHAG